MTGNSILPLLMPVLSLLPALINCSKEEIVNYLFVDYSGEFSMTKITDLPRSLDENSGLIYWEKSVMDFQ